jgi:hypothetical protein
MAHFWSCTQGTPPHLNPRNTWEILIQFRHVIAVTVIGLYYPSSLEYHHTALRMPFFYWKNGKCFKLCYERISSVSAIIKPVHSAVCFCILDKS